MGDSEYRELCREAQLLVRQQKFDEAIGLFQKASQLDGLDADCHEGMATALFMKGDLEHSRDEFKRTTELDPRRGRAFVNLGAVYNRLGQFKEAVGALRKAVQKERKSPQAYYNLGIAQKGMNQLSMAISAYKEALKLDPEMAEAHQNLGNVYLEMKNYSQATRSFTKALELRPGFKRAIQGLEKSKLAQEEARVSFSPFGRLVDETTLNDPKDSKHRRLTSDERFQDRQSLREMATIARNSGDELVAFLNDDLQPAIAELTAVFSKNQGSSSLLAAGESFLEELAVVKGTRERLAKTMQKIEAHELNLLQ